MNQYLMTFAKFLKFPAIIFSIVCVHVSVFVYQTLSLLLLGLWWDKSFVLSQRPLRLCPFFCHYFFSLCCSDWIISVSIYILFLAIFIFIPPCYWAHYMSFIFTSVIVFCIFKISSRFFFDFSNGKKREKEI